MATQTNTEKINKIQSTPTKLCKGFKIKNRRPKCFGQKYGDEKKSIKIKTLKCSCYLGSNLNCKKKVFAFSYKFFFFLFSQETKTCFIIPTLITYTNLE